MLVDPTVNVVVFKFSRPIQSRVRDPDLIEVEVDTLADNGIKQAWAKIQAGHAVTNKDVLEIFSEWSASDSDASFLKSEFPSVQISFSFKRPMDETDWKIALHDARQIMSESAVGKKTIGNELLLPVLRNEEDFMADVGVCHSLGAGLAISLAKVSKTECGTIAIDYLMKAKLNNFDAKSRKSLVAHSFNNLSKDMEVQKCVHDSGHDFVLCTHPLDHGASRICLPYFHEDAVEWLGGDSFFIGVPDPGSLWVARSDSPLVPSMTEAIVESEYSGSVPLTPAAFQLNADGLTRLAERPAMD